MHKIFLATLTAALLVSPLAAQAQDAPSYATGQYADDQNIHGRVTGFDGGYNLSVRDERGYLDHVQLHPGTIINPTGLTLAPGMIVSVLGYNAGSTFSANEIDTPYHFVDDAYFYGGHPWNYYGPSVSLGFFFGGNPGWWHGDYFRGGYGYAGGARVYNSVHVVNVYSPKAGRFQGRDYVAPAEHGGYYGHAASVHQAPSTHEREAHGEGRPHGDGRPH